MKDEGDVCKRILVARTNEGSPLFSSEGHLLSKFVYKVI